MSYRRAIVTVGNRTANDGADTQADDPQGNRIPVFAMDAVTAIAAINTLTIAVFEAVVAIMALVPVVYDFVVVFQTPLAQHIAAFRIGRGRAQWCKHGCRAQQRDTDFFGYGVHLQGPFRCSELMWLICLVCMNPIEVNLNGS